MMSRGGGSIKINDLSYNSVHFYQRDTGCNRNFFTDRYRIGCDAPVSHILSGPIKPCIFT